MPNLNGRLGVAVMLTLICNVVYGAATEYTCNCGDDYKEWNYLYQGSSKCKNSSQTNCIVSETSDTFVYRSSYHETGETACSVCGCFSYPQNWEPYQTGSIKKQGRAFSAGGATDYGSTTCTLGYIYHDYACAAGWYDLKKQGSYITCEHCPWFYDYYGSALPGMTKEPNNDGMESCYLEPTDWIYDETGTYSLTQKCYYSFE